MKMTHLIIFTFVIAAFAPANSVATAAAATTAVTTAPAAPLHVPRTYIKGAAAKGAFCLDGSLPVYQLHRGHGEGAKNWIVNFGGGGWCSTLSTDPNEESSCSKRKNNFLGSSIYMDEYIHFTGIMSNKAEQNPDFFNWNRVHVGYCDGASYAGDAENKEHGLYFRGQRIYQAAMDDLMSKGMRHANQALLCGGSAGGVAVVLHCDHFRSLFSTSTKVKCFSDAAFFTDSVDVSGGRSIRRRVADLVSLQGIEKMLPHSCTNLHGPISCFFPEVLINYIKTPMFVTSAAYDTAQIRGGIASGGADVHRKWIYCKASFRNCTSSHIAVMQVLRSTILNGLQEFGQNEQNGYFINACYAHGQMTEQENWLSHHSPHIDHKGISRYVAEWYFERARVRKIGPPYLFEKSCNNQEFTVDFNESTRY